MNFLLITPRLNKLKGLPYAARRLGVRSYTYFHGHPKWTEAPISLQIDTQNGCNLKCTYCNTQNQYVKQAQSLSTETIQQVLDEVKANGWKLSYVLLYMNGDGLSEPRLKDLAHRVKQTLGCKVVVYTNGTLCINQKLLITSDIDEVRFTISAATPETYYKVHGKDLFFQALSTLYAFTDYKFSNQRIFVNFVACQENVHELEKWKQLFSEYEQEVRPLHVSETQTQSRKDGIDATPLASNKNLRKHRYSGFRPCPCFCALQIGVHGEIMHCCDADYKYNYGLVGEVSLKEAWAHKLLSGLNSEACKGCNLKDPNWKTLFKKYVWKNQ